MVNFKKKLKNKLKREKKMTITKYSRFFPQKYKKMLGPDVLAIIDEFAFFNKRWFFNFIEKQYPQSSIVLYIKADVASSKRITWKYFWDKYSDFLITSTMKKISSTRFIFKANQKGYKLELSVLCGYTYTFRITTMNIYSPVLFVPLTYKIILEPLVMYLKNGKSTPKLLKFLSERPYLYIGPFISQESAINILESPHKLFASIFYRTEMEKLLFYESSPEADRDQHPRERPDSMFCIYDKVSRLPIATFKIYILSWFYPILNTKSENELLDYASYFLNSPLDASSG